MVSGIGWSIAQLLSFIPNSTGQIAGLLGMVLVIYHWNKLLKLIACYKSKLYKTTANTEKTKNRSGKYKGEITCPCL